MSKLCSPAFLGLSLLLLSSCKSQDPALSGLKTPMWSEDVVRKQPQAALTYETTLQMKPPFFTGSMPLQFTAGKALQGFDPSEMTNVYFDFGDFRNTFIYVDPRMLYSGMAEGAVTADSSGRLLAEARLLRMLPEGGGQLQALEIEEYQYKDGKVVFRCKSKFDFPMGFKQSESEAVGKKQRDYYFIWPVANM